MRKREVITRKLYSYEQTLESYRRKEGVSKAYLDLLIDRGIHPRPSLETQEGEAVFTSDDFDGFDWSGCDDEELYEIEDVEEVLAQALGKRRVWFNGDFCQAIAEGIFPTPGCLKYTSPSKPIFGRNEVDDLLKDEETVNDLKDFFK